MVAVTRPMGVGDLVFPTASAELWCQAFVDEKIPQLVLYGPPGTGKTAAASALMRSRIPGLNWGLDVTIHNAAADNSIAGITDAVETLYHSGDNPKGQRVLIIDEVDCLSSAAATSLKGLLDSVPGEEPPVIMMTNHVDRLESAMMSRSQKIHWPLLSHAALMKWAEDLCASQGRVLTPGERNAVALNATDYRQLKRYLATL